MKNVLMTMKDKILLRKGSVIETINNQLKNIAQAEHSRHRSFGNFIINLVAKLIAYSFKEKKPSIKFETEKQETISTFLLNHYIELRLIEINGLVYTKPFYTQTN